jgi:hypothetical protein
LSLGDGGGGGGGDEGDFSPSDFFSSASTAGAMVVVVVAVVPYYEGHVYIDYLLLHSSSIGLTCSGPPQVTALSKLRTSRRN